MKRFSTIAALAVMISFTAFLAQASAFSLPDPETTPTLTYLSAELGIPIPVASEHGDFYSFSLPVLALDYDLGFGGGTGPGSPYYVVSTPGAIQDDIVVATGVNGGPTVDNGDDADKAYETPSGVHGSTTFSTVGPGDPQPTITGDTVDTWDIELTALHDYLGGNDLIFFFNHNEENSGSTEEQALFGWGRIALVDLQGGLPTEYFYFANPGNATAYDNYAPNADNYVYAPGQITLGNYTINHNLGANQAAYAMISPDLNDMLNNSTYAAFDVMQVELRLSGLSNGYEQLFIQRGDRVTNIIPEPSSLVLLGMGLLGTFGLIRRKKK